MSRSDKPRDQRPAAKPSRPAPASQVFGRFLCHVARLESRQTASGQGKSGRSERSR